MFSPIFHLMFSHRFSPEYPIHALLGKVFRICQVRGWQPPKALVVIAPWQGWKKFRPKKMGTPTWQGWKEFRPKNGNPNICALTLSFLFRCKADNTVREAKNQYLMTFLNLLTAKFLLKSCTLCHLRKSHTHCRIGLGV